MESKARLTEERREAQTMDKAASEREQVPSVMDGTD